MSNHRAFGLAVEALDVVVVEDSRPMQTLFRSMLAAIRVGRIRVFDEAEAAYRAMIQDTPHLLIADWKMKPVSGLQLLKAIRQKDLAPLNTVPAIVISAHATRNLVESAYRVGAHSFLVKPVAPSVLYRAITRILVDRRPFQVDGDSLVIDGVIEKLGEAGRAPVRPKAAEPVDAGAAPAVPGYGTITAAAR